ncbi:FkbM family methyltransferase [Nostocales cyanobacterium LEGE 11386]|nr:FkbM family methyltransferase [Nostocales cyanobacterium LEGE 11386]
MSIPFFLYRRLANWITCEFNFQPNKKTALKNKYEVASFKDVFCHPFYWQLFQYIHECPKLVLDCGAHCGHFTILADICFQSKFASVDTEYILIEPNPYLLPIIKQNISDMDLNYRVQIKQGLLGEKSGSEKLWVKPKNYLSTGLAYSKGAKPFQVPFIDIQEIVGNRIIDLMKIDIEGGEFAFVRSHIDIFKQVNLIFMELHEASEELHHEISDSLNSVGLNLAAKPIKSHGQQLLIWQRL